MYIRSDLTFAAALVAAMACNGDSDPSPYQLGTGDSAQAGGDSDTTGDSPQGGGDIEPAGCACDATGACDSYCYCDADCTNPCGCDVTWDCDLNCSCDVGCSVSTVDLFPYNKCYNNNDCDGGFCLKGACVLFCHPQMGCGYGFTCVDGVCLYNCTISSDCAVGSSTDCCVDGSCLPAALCGDDAGPSWQCPAVAYGGLDGCDCGCGLEDPDCDGSGCTWCNDAGTLLPLCSP